MQRDVTHLFAAVVLALAPLSGLAACSGGASAWSGPNAGIKAEPDRGMSPATKKGTLLYVSNSSSSDAYVAVYTYPKLRLVGKLTGFTSPEGECADAAGDVWVADFFLGTSSSTRMVEQRQSPRSASRARTHSAALSIRPAAISRSRISLAIRS